MIKASAIASVFIFFTCSLFAQEPVIPELSKLNSAAKNQFVTIEQLDKIQHGIKYFDEHQVLGIEQKRLLFDTYRSIANGYAINNHFKQGYAVYQKYLGLKEKYIALEKGDAINQLVKELDAKQSEDENELIDRKNEKHQLQLDNSHLDSKRRTFKQYFSFGVTILTVMFSFLLLQAGLKMNKIRHDLKAGRERLKFIHRVATIGRLKNGIFKIFKKAFDDLNGFTEKCVSIAAQIPPSSNKKNDELSALKKQLNELKNLS